MVRQAWGVSTGWPESYSQAWSGPTAGSLESWTYLSGDEEFWGGQRRSQRLLWNSSLKSKPSLLNMTSASAEADAWLQKDQSSSVLKIPHKFQPSRDSAEDSLYSLSSVLSIFRLVKKMPSLSVGSQKDLWVRKHTRKPHKHGLLLGCVFIVFFHHLIQFLKIPQIIGFLFFISSMYFYLQNQKHITISALGRLQKWSPSISH